MRFLVDAQLPARLAEALNGAGHDAMHTSALPDGNRSTDARICELADAEERVVITKDRDFRASHLLARSPRRLLIIATGNIPNAMLLSLLHSNLEAIIDALHRSDLVELSRDTLIAQTRERDEHGR